MAERNPECHKGHRNSLRKKFIDSDFTGFNKHNLLELLLFYSIPRIDTNELAHSLLDTFGSLKGVFDAPIDAIMSVKGIGKNSAVLLKLIPVLMREYLNEDTDSTKYIFSTEEAVQFLKPKFFGLNSEAVYFICLDDSGRVLKNAFVGQGDFDSTTINVRKFASQILNSNADAVIIAHNHPVGVCAPSKEDIDTTIKLKNLLDSISVSLMDHIIFANDGYFSFLKNNIYSYIFS